MWHILRPQIDFCFLVSLCLAAVEGHSSEGCQAFCPASNNLSHVLHNHSLHTLGTEKCTHRRMLKPCLSYNCAVTHTHTCSNKHFVLLQCQIMLNKTLIVGGFIWLTRLLWECSVWPKTKQSYLTVPYIHSAYLLTPKANDHLSIMKVYSTGIPGFRHRPWVHTDESPIPLLVCLLWDIYQLQL